MFFNKIFLYINTGLWLKEVAEAFYPLLYAVNEEQL
jgi:hypothetical protein